MKKLRRLRFPSIFLCIGRRKLKRGGEHGLTSCSGYRVHHLDFFQEPRVIVLCCVPSRMVGVVNTLGGHQLTGPSFPAEFSQSSVSAQYICLAHL